MIRRRELLRRLLGSDGGSYALETAVLAPVLIVILGLMIAFGRVTDAEGDVDSAAHAAARAASLERDAASAQSRAQDAVIRSLDGEGITCRTSSVTISTGGYAVGVGEAATVTATISCTANLSDIAVPGLPGSKTLTASWTSPIDTYRGRALGFADSEVPWSANQSVGAEE
ncbi:TadE/TadG family type IV pilus assembly protein [Streptomyces sp. NPDC055955]|uniref:TadE/TadG family type IV pilus assembly protein n=1 Tax=Streptomyces sp. NPDC055955 TaxID=3345665 RepID=UPI0035DFAE25